MYLNPSGKMSYVRKMLTLNRPFSTTTTIIAPVILSLLVTACGSVQNLEESAVSEEVESGPASTSPTGGGTTTSLVDVTTTTGTSAATVDSASADGQPVQCVAVVDAFLDIAQEGIRQLGALGLRVAADDEPWDYIDVEPSQAESDLDTFETAGCDSDWLFVQTVTRSDELTADTPAEAAAKATTVAPNLTVVLAMMDSEEIDRLLDLQASGREPEPTVFEPLGDADCTDLPAAQRQVVSRSIAVSSTLSVTELMAWGEQQAADFQRGVPVGGRAAIEGIRFRAGEIGCDLAELTEQLLMDIEESSPTGPVGTIVKLQLLWDVTRWLVPSVHDEVTAELTTNPLTSKQLVIVRNDGNSQVTITGFEIVYGEAAATIDVGQALPPGEQHIIPLQTEERAWTGTVHWTGPDGSAESHIISLTLAALVR